MRRLTFVILVLILLTTACTSESISFIPQDGDEDTDGDTQLDGDIPDGDVSDGDSDGDDTDGDTDIPDGDTDEPPVVNGFRPDKAAADFGEIILGNPTLEDGYLILDVVGNGFDNLLGIAFRLNFDPTVLALGEVEAGVAIMGHPVLAASQGRSGEAIVGITNTGGLTSVMFSPTKIVQVAFRILADGETRIDFDPSPWHSVVSDAKLKAMPAKFYGGTFVGGEGEAK